MSKTRLFLRMAALVLASGSMGACSSVDNEIESKTEAPSVSPSNIVTVTATVTREGSAATRALTKDGVKTFTTSEKIAVIYENTSSVQKLAEASITSLSADGKTATISVNLESPKEGNSMVYYKYPASLADVSKSGLADLEQLYTGQDGTLATLASKFDFCEGEGTMTVSGSEVALPAKVAMKNKLAVCKFTVNNGPNDVTSGVTQLTLKLTKGTDVKTYTVNRTAAPGPIYVAVKPETTPAIEWTVNGPFGTTKQPTGEFVIDANRFYSIKLDCDMLTDLSKLPTGEYIAKDGEILTGTISSGDAILKIDDGARVTLRDVRINTQGTELNNNHAGITCTGDATITLEGSNTVVGYAPAYAGISAYYGKTLTIGGTGSLVAKNNNKNSNGSGAGIGCDGNGSVGNIVITGGTITAEGGATSSGIGCSDGHNCGTITIKDATVTAITHYGSGTAIGNAGSGSSSKCTSIAVSGNTNLTLQNTAAQTGNNFGSTQMNQILYADAVTIGSDDIKSDINSTLGVFSTKNIIKTDFSFDYDLTSQTVTISKK